jgi:hypothetical protein
MNLLDSPPALGNLRILIRVVITLDFVRNLRVPHTDKDSKFSFFLH